MNDQISAEKVKLFSKLDQTGEIACWNWDLKHGVFTATDTFYRLFNLDPPADTFKSSNILNLLQKRLNNEQIARLTQGVKHIQQLKRPITESLIYQADYGEINLKFQIEPEIENGKVVGAFGMIRTIDNLIAEQDKFSKFAKTSLNHLDAMIFWVERDGSFLYVNYAASQALQYTKVRLLQEMNLYKIDVYTESQKWDDYWNELKKNDSIQFETSLQRSDQTLIFVKVNLICLETGTDGLMCLSATDISQERQRETRLQNTLVEIGTLKEKLNANASLLQDLFIGSEGIDIIAQDVNYVEIVKQIKSVAPTDSTVLLLGETGTGKELLARAIHQLSARKNRPLVKVNCAALPENLIESELFGHEKGAFTGAYRRTIGRFEMADKGTLFLDEIGELSTSMQVKILRVLQEQEFERVGGTETISVDVRLICATNRNLREMMKEGKFREDLYYRISIFPIENIPLRERKTDIPLLAEHFLHKYAKKIGKDIQTIRAKDLDRLRAYNYPGNVRELENIIERAVILTQGTTLSLAHWKEDQSFNGATQNETHSFPTFEEIQKQHILAALEKTNWQVSGDNGAAQLLDLNDRTLFSKMNKLGINRKG